MSACPIIAPQPAEGPEWYVVRAKAKKEEFARQNLQRRGLVVFLPRIRERRGSGRDAVAPLFPGYLFVYIALTDGYYRVVWTPGVRTFVCFGDAPTPVQPQVIDLIRGSAGEEGIIEPGPRLRRGDRVQITAGPFAGLMAIIERPCSQRGRVKVLLDFLRRGATVELPEEFVDRV